MLRPLKVGLDPARRDVPAESDPVDLPIIAKISFGGDLSLTEPDARRGYKGRLYWADEGELIYSKIRVKQGSIAVVPTGAGRIAVSAEYPVFTVDPKVFLPEYLTRVLRSAPFQSTLDGLAHGGSTKTRISPSTFKDLRVPAIPLRQQAAIVGHARDAAQRLRAAADEADRLQREAHAAFFAALGLVLPDETARPKVMVARWKQVDRWGVAYNQAVRGGLDLHASRFEVEPLGDLLTATQYGTSTKANTHGKGAPVLRIGNIKDGRIDMSDLKHVVLLKGTRESLELSAGDVLIIRTSGSRSLVGTTAVVGEEAVGSVFASYLIRLCINREKADPHYISAFINGAGGRAQIEVLARQIMQNNINSEEIRSLLVPLPPLGVQEELVRLLVEARTRAVAIRAEAQQRHDQAMKEVDAMILGTMPVPTA